MIVVLDAEKMTEKQEAHAYLKEKLDLPDYYGNNLDALHDCLEEMKDVQLVILNEANAGEYYKKIKRVLDSIKEEV